MVLYVMRRVVIVSKLHAINHQTIARMDVILDGKETCVTKV